MVFESFLKKLLTIQNLCDNIIIAKRQAIQKLFHGVKKKYVVFEKSVDKSQGK
jgi:hypothetical protein